MMLIAAGTAGSGIAIFNTETENNFSFEVMTICYQGLVASCLLYFVFRHHYRHH